MRVNSIKLERKTQVAQYEMMTVEALFLRDDGESASIFRERALLEFATIHADLIGHPDKHSAHGQKMIAALPKSELKQEP